MLLTFLLVAAACTSAPTSVPTTPPPTTTTTTTTIPVGPGRCGQPLLTDERIPDSSLAAEIIARFIADRVAGEGAEGCLTADAAQTYASESFPACLYTCSDLATIELPDKPVPVDEGETTLGPVRSVVVTYKIGDALTRTMREVYKVQTVRGPDDQRQVLIGSVGVEPQSQVDDVSGRQVIDDLFASLAEGAWDVAQTLLVDEGASDAVLQRLPDIITASPTDVLAPFCETALCDAPYEILGSEATSAVTRTYQVRFTSDVGPVTVEVPVSAFEGRLRVEALPPEGLSSEAANSLEDMLFPDGHESPLALVHYNAIQLAGAGWFEWSFARATSHTQIVSSNVLFEAFDGVRLATIGETTIGAGDVIAAGGWSLAGVAMDAEEPVALVTDGRRLVSYRLSDKNVRTIVDMGSSEQSISCASVGGDAVLVTSHSPTAYDLYSFADGSLIAHFEPDKASGCALLAPDGSTFVYTADVSLGSPQTIVLAAAADGTEIDRWSVLADAVIGSPTQFPLVFDGRYAIADLAAPPDEAPYVQNEDLGRRFVVDTQTGDQWTVDVSAQVLFPPG